MCPNGRKSYLKLMLRKRNGGTGWVNKYSSVCFAFNFNIYTR
jgi:hypothetical protein